MNSKKWPILLTKQWVKTEEVNLNQDIKQSVVKKTTLEVSDEIISNIQQLLEWKTNNSQWENISFVNILCDSFWFDFDIHTEVETTWVNKRELTHNYTLNQEWEEIILQLLEYLEIKNNIETRLNSDINVERLNKKLKYCNSKIVTKSTYSHEELDELLKVVNNDKVISEEIEITKERYNNSKIYKQLLSVLLQQHTRDNFTNWWSDIINNSPELLVIYNKIVNESKNTVKNQYAPVSYTYSEENTEYIEKQKIEKENKAKEIQDEQELIIAQELEIESQKKHKSFKKKAIQIWFIVSLVTWWVMLNNNSQEKESENPNKITSKNVEKYANDLYDELVLKNKISDEILLETYDKFNDFIISFMDTIWPMEWDINKLKWLLVQNIQLTSGNNELLWKDVIMNVSNNWNDTLIITIKIGNKIIMNNKIYSRKPLHKPDSISQINENKLKELALDEIKHYMKQSTNRDELIKNISNNFWYIIRKVFINYTQYFNVQIQYFWNKIYIKCINNNDKQEYNLSFELDKHLQE